MHYEAKDLDCLMMVDRAYFARKMGLILAGLESYTGNELARELHRLANTASTSLHKWPESKPE